MLVTAKPPCTTPGGAVHADHTFGNPEREPAFSGFRLNEPATSVAGADGGHPSPLNGHSYRSTVAPRGGVFMLPLSAEHRLAAGIAAGDEVEVALELDTEPRTVTLPADFAEALDCDADARHFFDGLSYSHQRQHVLAIEDAKTPETRLRRIDKALAMLREGRR
ncbi:MAG: DUF1905 domain-containing protein [Ardenticatenia bacterium]|nr:DUF1905 domain-containing protein [Ardenticatenia bacterium]